MFAVVTGGFGFLGSHLCEALSRAGWQFIVVDALRPEAVNLSFVCSLPGFIPRSTGDDVADPVTWADLEYEDVKPDAVFHLAAETHVDRSLGLEPTTLAATRDPVERLYRTNVIGTARVAEYARKVGARLVHWSTDEVYGDACHDPEGLKLGKVNPRLQITPAGEMHAFAPSSPYAASKAAAEMAVLASVRLGLKATILRPSNAYGARQARDKLLPMAIGKLSRGEPVPLYDGGWQIRQWVHAEDIARAALLAVEKRADRPMNLGGPSLLRNSDLIRLLAKTGMPLIANVPDRPGHDAAYCIVSGRVLRDLGWTPSRRIEDDVAELWAAYAG